MEEAEYRNKVMKQYRNLFFYILSSRDPAKDIIQIIRKTILKTVTVILITYHKREAEMSDKV